MSVGQLHTVDQAQYLIKVTASRWRIDNRGPDFLVRVDHIHRPHRDFRVGIRVDHIVQRRDLFLRVSNDWEIDCRALRIFDIGDPLFVFVNRIYRNDDGFRAAIGQLVLQLGGVAELGCAHRREVSRVGKEHDPILANPVVEVDAALGGFSFEVGGGIAEEQAHDFLSLSGLIYAAKVGRMARGLNRMGLTGRFSFPARE